MTNSPPRDEAVDAHGVPRPHYAALLAALDETNLAALSSSVGAHAIRERVTHDRGEREAVLHIDPVPRIIEADEFAALERGLAQRVRALDFFVADAHGPREAVRAGVIGAGVIDSSRYFERDLLDAPPPPVRIGIAGPDLVRGPEGELVVLEDNVRTPTLMGYAAFAREAVGGRLASAGLPAPLDPAPVLRHHLQRVLASAAPGVDEPVAVVLDDGEACTTRWEIEHLAGELGIRSVALADLAHRGGRLALRDGGRPVDVILRRTAEERLRTDAGGLTALGDALLDPLKAGTVAVVNAFGTGVADDKRVYPYVEDLIRFFCDEEPLLRSVPTLELARADHLAEALERMDELVFKPRSGSGGHGLVLGDRATAAEREELTRAVRADPTEWVAQELLRFSTHPTVIDGRLAPRHVDLRPFVLCAGGEIATLPGGFSRVALKEDELVVSVSQHGGGGKDVWVLAP